MNDIEAAEKAAMAKKWLEDFIEACGGLTAAADALGTYKQRLDRLLREGNFEKIMKFAEAIRKERKFTERQMYRKLLGK